MIRSLGGWQAVKDARFSGQDRIKSDHRILGDSAFVMEVLAEAEEKFERFYELKSKGYNLDTIAQKVCDIFGIEPEEIYSQQIGQPDRKPRAITLVKSSFLCAFFGGLALVSWRKN